MLEIGGTGWRVCGNCTIIYFFINLNYSVKQIKVLFEGLAMTQCFLSLCSFESVCCLADSTSLSDITFDGNPIAQESWYKHTVLQNMQQLRQLDMKRVTVRTLTRCSLGCCPHCGLGNWDVTALLDTELGIIVNVTMVYFIIIIIDFFTTLECHCIGLFKFLAFYLN